MLLIFLRMMSDYLGHIVLLIDYLLTCWLCLSFNCFITSLKSLWILCEGNRLSNQSEGTDQGQNSESVHVIMTTVAAIAMLLLCWVLWQTTEEAFQKEKGGDHPNQAQAQINSQHPAGALRLVISTLNRQASAQENNVIYCIGEKRHQTYDW